MECNERELRTFKKMLKERKKERLQEQEQAMADKVTAGVMQQLEAAGYGPPRTEIMSDVNQPKSKKKSTKAKPDASEGLDTSESDGCYESPKKPVPNRYHRLRNQRDEAKARADESESLLRELLKPSKAGRYSSDGEETSSPAKGALRAASLSVSQRTGTIT